MVARRAPSSVPSARLAPRLLAGRAFVVTLVASVASVAVACGDAPSPPAKTAADAPAVGAPAARMACEGTTLRTPAKEYCLMTARRSFDQAAAECDRMKGRLAVLEDLDEAKRVGALLASPWGYGSGLWLGCTDAESEGKWTCEGKPLGYTNWLPGQPDNGAAVDDCQEWLADTGQWNDASCAQRLGYLCRGDASMKCTGRRVTSGSAVFCAHGEDPQDWDSAQKACAQSGGKLAVLGSAEEGRALLDALKSPRAIPSNQPGEGVWIGLSDQKEETKFRWSNDAPMKGGNWLPGQPDDSNGSEDCATLTLGDGRWNDVDCIRGLPFLCEAR